VFKKSKIEEVLRLRGGGDEFPELLLLKIYYGKTED
jgi:hypothetical protein